jgi:DNA-binding MarR family transcriptional regulator
MGTDQPPWRRAATHTLHTAFVLKALIEQRLQEELGLLLADNKALLSIAHAERPLRMTDIAHRLVLSPGGATKVVDRLEERGLADRLPDPDDRRATVVVVTPAGEDAIRTARTIVDSVLEPAWAAYVTDEEAEVITEVMRRVMAANHGDIGEEASRG